tara:strand:- start:1668 stop:2114 length:447 start_codon:yes stop_codon:yes gene_type:complete
VVPEVLGTEEMIAHARNVEQSPDVRDFITLYLEVTPIRKCHKEIAVAFPHLSPLDITGNKHSLLTLSILLKQQSRELVHIRAGYIFNHKRHHIEFGLTRRRSRGMSVYVFLVLGKPFLEITLTTFLACTDIVTGPIVIRIVELEGAQV